MRQPDPRTISTAGRVRQRRSSHCPARPQPWIGGRDGAVLAARPTRSPERDGAGAESGSAENQGECRPEPSPRAADEVRQENTPQTRTSATAAAAASPTRGRCRGRAQPPSHQSNHEHEHGEQELPQERRTANRASACRSTPGHAQGRGRTSKTSSPRRRVPGVGAKPGVPSPPPTCRVCTRNGRGHRRESRIARPPFVEKSVPRATPRTTGEPPRLSQRWGSTRPTSGPSTHAPDAGRCAGQILEATEPFMHQRSRRRRATKQHELACG